MAATKTLTRPTLYTLVLMAYDETPRPHRAVRPYHYATRALAEALGARACDHGGADDFQVLPKLEYVRDPALDRDMPF